MPWLIVQLWILPDSHDHRLYISLYTVYGHDSDLECCNQMNQILILCSIIISISQENYFSFLEIMMIFNSWSQNNSIKKKLQARPFSASVETTWLLYCIFSSGHTRSCNEKSPCGTKSMSHVKETPVKLLTGHLQLQTWSIITLSIVYFLSLGGLIFVKHF